MKKCRNCPYPDSLCTSLRMKVCDVDMEELKKQINTVLDILYTNDYYLIEQKVNEVCLSTHFWHYFKLNFTTKYPGYNIDPEYNRNGEKCKYFEKDTDSNYYSAKPDMIIHRRGCNRYNFAYFEFKGHWYNKKQ